MDFFAETFPACGSFPTSHHQTFSYLPARRRVVPHPSGALPHHRPWAGPQTEAGWARRLSVFLKMLIWKKNPYYYRFNYRSASRAGQLFVFFFMGGQDYL
jgi:hypothetical protein